MTWRRVDHPHCYRGPPKGWHAFDSQGLSLCGDFTVPPEATGQEGRGRGAYCSVCEKWSEYRRKHGK